MTKGKNQPTMILYDIQSKTGIESDRVILEIKSVQTFLSCTATVLLEQKVYKYQV